MERSLALWPIAATASLLALSGCGRDCVHGTGSPVTKEITLVRFESLVNTGSFKVEVEKGDTQHVWVTAQQEVIDRIKPTVDNGVWKITTEGCINTSEPVIVRITVPLLNLVATKGSGGVQCTNVFNTGKTDFRIEGSGSIVVNGISEELIKAKLEGSGSLTISGTCRDLVADLNGSGSLVAAQLSVNEADVKTGGSGEAQLTVISALKASISGSGSVRYRGTPVVTSKITGSGAVVPLE